MSWLGRIIDAFSAGLRGENIPDDLEYPDLGREDLENNFNFDSDAPTTPTGISLIGNLLLTGPIQSAVDFAIFVAQETGYEYMLANANEFGPIGDLTAELINVMPGHLLILMNIQSLPSPFVESLVHALETRSISINVSSDGIHEVPIESYPIIATCTNIDYCAPQLLAHFPIRFDTETGLIQTIDLNEIPYVPGQEVNSNDPRSLTTDSALLLLGLVSGASKEDIQQAYRRRIAEWHPDKLDGMASELKVLATERMKMLNAAYELLKA
jgi:DnaJ domain